MKKAIVIISTLFCSTSVLMPSAAAADEGKTTATPSQKQAAAPPSEELKQYYDKLWQTIQKTWWVPQELLFKQVKLHLIIAKDGQLESISVAKTSGEPRADNLALIGVKRAAPFPPLPESVQAPLNTFYTIGFQSNEHKNFSYFDGKKYGAGESYTLPTGTKVGHGDNKISELDKQFHIKKEAALLKMNKIDDTLAEANKTPLPADKKAQLLSDYAHCLIQIQEQAQARDKMTQALALMESNKAADSDLLPYLSQLAQLDYTIGDMTAAEPLFKKALTIREAQDSNAPDPAYKSLLESYARLLYKQNRTAEADELYKKIKTLR